MSWSLALRETCSFYLLLLLTFGSVHILRTLPSSAVSLIVEISIVSLRPQSLSCLCILFRFYSLYLPTAGKLRLVLVWFESADSLKIKIGKIFSSSIFSFHPPCHCFPMLRMQSAAAFAIHIRQLHGVSLALTLSLLLRIIFFLFSLFLLSLFHSSIYFVLTSINFFLLAPSVVFVCTCVRFLGDRYARRTTL